ncbi:MAG: BON domain-containing protein [Betaproteobacteria bacterium]|nr:BON domain-containing protein [Betaproteobacteria bacterium]
MKLRILSCCILTLSLLLQGCPLLIFGAAVGGTAMVVNERRSGEVLIADERIELTSNLRLRASGHWERLNLNVTSYNRIALLTGQAANDEARLLAEKIVSEIPGVRGVSNELVIGPFSTFGARSGDSFTTTQVKARLVTGNGVNSSHVKVVTEASVVYLMGLVTEAESDAAAKTAAGTQGVTKVVKYFEYITDPAPAADLKK